MRKLREIDGDNLKEEQPEHKGTRLVEVTNQGQTSQMTREEVEALKERQDIRIADHGDKATVLNRLRG